MAANERMRAVEVKIDNLAGDIVGVKTDIKEDLANIQSDVKLLLVHKITAENQIASIRNDMRRIAGWVSVITTGAINTGFLFWRAYLESKS